MMRLQKKIATYLCAIVVSFETGCGSVAPSDAETRINATNAETQVNAALYRYRELIVRMQPASIARLFAEQGSISHANQVTIVGRQAIETFLASFANYKINEYELNVKSILVENQTATQLGTYRQVVIIPAGQTVVVQGIFVAKWELHSGGQWLLRSMHTESNAPE